MAAPSTTTTHEERAPDAKDGSPRHSVIAARRGDRPHRGAEQQPVEERAARADDGQTAEERHLRAELVRLRRHEQRARDGDEEAEHDPTASAPDGTVFGSVIMKNRKIRTSGDVTITRQ